MTASASGTGRLHLQVRAAADTQQRDLGSCAVAGPTPVVALERQARPAVAISTSLAALRVQSGRLRTGFGLGVHR